MSISTTNVRNDIGELWASVDNGTTAVASIITRAENFVKLQTGTTTAYDSIIRPLSDAMVVNQMMGGIDPVNKTIGSLSVGPKDLRTMQQYFKHEANKAAVIKGISLDGLTIIFKDTEG